MTVRAHTHTNNYVIRKFDAFWRLLRASDCPSVYHGEIATFNDWCDSHFLMLHKNKTKEMIYDSRKVRVHDPVILNNGVIEQVSSSKYLGIMLDNKLNWSAHIDYLCSRLAQRLHLLWRLQLFGVQSEIMITFCNAVLESIIRWYGCLVWLSHCPVRVQTNEHHQNILQSDGNRQKPVTSAYLWDQCSQTGKRNSSWPLSHIISWIWAIAIRKTLQCEQV